MKVRDIMESPAPTITPDTPVARVASAILGCAAPGLPVVDGTGVVVGLVTQRDLVAKHARLHLPWYFGFLGGAIPFERDRTEEDLRRILAVTARDLMEEHFVSVPPDMDVDDAAALMVDRDADPLLVVDGDGLAGLVSHANIIRLLLAEETGSDEAADV